MPSNLNLVGNKHLCGVRMILKDKSGHVLYEAGFKTIKESLEHCAQNNIPLSGVCIRKARVQNAMLDGLIAPNASFWGCDFAGSDIGYANLQRVDFRASNLENVCFSRSDLTDSDMRGAYFGGVIADGAVFDGVKVSCPSFWGCDLSSLSSLQNLVFLHKGEQEMVLKEQPLVLRYKNAPIVIANNHCLWRSGLYPSGLLPFSAKAELFVAKTHLEKILKGTNMQNAKRTMPKIAG